MSFYTKFNFEIFRFLYASCRVFTMTSFDQQYEGKETGAVGRCCKGIGY